MGEEELRLALENLRGRLVRQDTVLKMSMAEQRRLNADAARTMERLREALELLDQRLARGERRLAGYTGALASLWLVIQIVQILLR